MAIIDILSAYWAMDEASGDALDAHGSYDLTDINTVGAASGKVAGARDFESDNDETFSHADDPITAMGADTPFCVAMWINRETVTTVHPFFANSQGTGDFHEEYSLRYDHENQKLIGRINDAVVVEHTITLSTATWYFVVFWHDPVANTVTIRVNDSAETSAAHTTGTTYWAGSIFKIGGQAGSSADWDGLIDEVAWFNGAFPSTAQQTWLYNAGAGRSYADIVAEAGGALLESLTDDFNDNTLDTAKWVVGHPIVTPDTDVTVAETSNQLRVTTATGAGVQYRGYTSVETYDLTGSHALVKVPSVAGSLYSTELIIALDSTNYYRMHRYGTDSLIATEVVAGTPDELANVTYNSTDHLWWRIRNAGATIYFETSADTITWDVLFTTLAANFDITAVKVHLGAGTDEDTTAATAQFDDFNLAPSDTITPPQGILTLTGYSPTLSIPGGGSPAASHWWAMIGRNAGNN